MYRSFLLPLLPVLLTCLAPLAAAEGRTWTDSSGQQQVEADLLDFNDVKVWLRRSDNRVFVAELAELSQADRQYVAEQARQRATEIAAQTSAQPAAAIRYAPPRKLCELANQVIDESSGLACSRNRPGVFWTHNDSDDAPRIYAFDTAGRDLGSWLVEGADGFDWEDIASFSMDGKSYLLVGDTGNNGLVAAVQVLYLIEEPPIDPTQGVVPKKVSVAQVINVRYEDRHRDCEALAVDPTSKTILLASKEKVIESHVYALPWPVNDPKKIFDARKIATLEIPMVTAMDVSPDGRRAIVLTYGNAYEYTRRGDEDWAKTFSRPGRIIPMPTRAQGESICYGPDGKTLYLTSEKLPTPLWEVRALP